MIDIEVEVEKVAKIAQLRKTEVCQEDNGISDMQSFVVFEKGDLFECRQSGVDGHPFRLLPDVLSEAFNDGLDEFDTVSLVVDSYVRMVKPAEGRQYERGELEREFKNNPKTDVVEALTIATYGYHGGRAGRCISYVYNDNGLPEFTVIEGQKDQLIKSEFVDFVMDKYINFCKANKTK